MPFSYVSAEDVAPLIKGGLTSQNQPMLEAKLQNLSSQLSGRFPGLRKTFLAEKALVDGGEEEFSDLVDLVESMVIEAGRVFISNPDGMSSETIGVFAYSRFENEDAKGTFKAADLAALKELLEADRNKQVGSFQMNMPYNGYVASPMPTPTTYSEVRGPRKWRR